MKKFLLISFLFLSSYSLFSQSTIDFETVGQNFVWSIFANGPSSDSTDFAVVENPSQTGINTSSHVAKFVVRANADPWAGIYTDSAASFTITAQNCYPKVMVYKDVISNFNLKFEGFSGAHDVKVPNTVINQWEELTFDYSADIGKVVTRITIIPDFPDTRTSGSTNYFDNIDFGMTVPVELTNFSYSVSGDDIVLKWQTATETNNRGFEVQRKLNNSEFSSIGFVEGSGTTTERKEYSYVDKNLKSGANYLYRLKQIDLNGVYNYSKIINTNGTIPGKFSLEQNYPNPFNPTTNISYSLPVKSNVTLEVYNLIGQKISTLVQGEIEAGKHSVDFNGSGISSGIYLFRLTAIGEDGSHFISNKKMTLLK